MVVKRFLASQYSYIFLAFIITGIVYVIVFLLALLLMIIKWLTTLATIGVIDYYRIWWTLWFVTWDSNLGTFKVNQFTDICFNYLMLFIVASLLMIVVCFILAGSTSFFVVPKVVAPDFTSRAKHAIEKSPFRFAAKLGEKDVFVLGRIVLPLVFGVDVSLWFNYIGVTNLILLVLIAFFVAFSMWVYSMWEFVKQRHATFSAIFTNFKIAAFLILLLSIVLLFIIYIVHAVITLGYIGALAGEGMVSQLGWWVLAPLSIIKWLQFALFLVVGAIEWVATLEVLKNYILHQFFKGDDSLEKDAAQHSRNENSGLMNLVSWKFFFEDLAWIIIINGGFVLSFLIFLLAPLNVNYISKLCSCISTIPC
jgi:hypothetical protein